MALDVSPRGLWEEVRRSMDVRDKYIGENYREAIRRYYGPAYREGETAEIDFENHGYAWISIFLPILASGNPRIRARTPRQGEAAAFAKATELAVNRNFELTDIKKTIEQLAVSWAFRYAVGFTSPEPLLGMREREDPPFRPTTKSLPLDHYIWDALAYQDSECRFKGHKIIRDKDSILQEVEEHPERGWDPAAVSLMMENRANEKKRVQMQSPPRRNDVEMWEIWIPEIQLDEALDAEGNPFQPTTKEGFHGTIFTVCAELDGWPREPRPFWGPRDGAYTFNGYLFVPDEVVPLSPLVATAAQAEIYNAVVSSVVENIKRYKRGIALTADSGNLDEILADFEDAGILKIDGVGQKLSDMMQQVEMLGITDQHAAQMTMLRDILERASGISEAVQGAPESGVTATASSIASMSTGKRMGFMTEKFIGGMLKPIAKKEAWYLTMDPRSRTPLGELAEGLFLDPKTGQPIELPVLVGGPEHGDFLEDMDVEIQPVFMRFTTEMLEAEREASWEQFLLSTAPMIPSTPYLDWGLIYQRKADQLGDPSLARTVDVQKAMLMGMMNMMATMGMAQPGLATSQSSSQPRLGVDMKRPQTPQLKASEKPAGFTSNARQSAAKSGQKNKGPRTPGMSATAR